MFSDSFVTFASPASFAAAILSLRHPVLIFFNIFDPESDSIPSPETGFFILQLFTKSRVDAVRY